MKEAELCVRIQEKLAATFGPESGMKPEKDRVAMEACNRFPRACARARYRMHGETRRLTAGGKALEGGPWCEACRAMCAYVSAPAWRSLASRFVCGGGGGGGGRATALARVRAQRAPVPRVHIPHACAHSEDSIQLVQQDWTGTFKVEGGTVYLVSTPIGNLGDITLRALQCLREVDVIAAEDTRVTGVLLKHLLGRRLPNQSFFSHHEHNWQRRVPELVDRAAQGQSIAVVTDAGTPCISDPGFELVRECRSAGVSVVPIPGACAMVAALSVSGVDTSHALFLGFLTSNATDRRRALDAVGSMSSGAAVMYESPYRIRRLMKEIREDGRLAKRLVVTARELTKLHEEVRHFDNAGDATAYYESHEPRGEFVVILGGAPRKKAKREQSTADSVVIETTASRLIHLLHEANVSTSTIARCVSQTCGLSKRQVYDFVVQLPRHQEDTEPE